jgi:hypothetical protein
VTEIPEEQSFHLLLADERMGNRRALHMKIVGRIDAIGDPCSMTSPADDS